MKPVNDDGEAMAIHAAIYRQFLDVIDLAKMSQDDDSMHYTTGKTFRLFHKIFCTICASRLDNWFHQHVTNTGLRLATDQFPKDRNAFFSDARNYHSKYGAGIDLSHVWFKKNTTTTKKRAADDTPDPDHLARL